jgi:hypothetical protein
MSASETFLHHDTFGPDRPAMRGWWRDGEKLDYSSEAGRIPWLRPSGRFQTTFYSCSDRPRMWQHSERIVGKETILAVCP